MTLASESPMTATNPAADAATPAADTATEKRDDDLPEAMLARRQQRISRVLLWIGAMVLIAFGATWNLYVFLFAFQHATERPPINCFPKSEWPSSPAGTATANE
jgi:hypothetical protein